MISQWCFEGKWQSLCSGLIASSPRLIARQIVFFPKSSSYPSPQSRNLNKTKIAQNVLEWVDSHNVSVSDNKYPKNLQRWKLLDTIIIKVKSCGLFLDATASASTYPVSE